MNPALPYLLLLLPPVFQVNSLSQERDGYQKINSCFIQLLDYMENPSDPIRTFEHTFSHCHWLSHSDICHNTEKDKRFSSSKLMFFFWVVSPSFECLSLDPSMLVQSLMINPALCDALPHFTPCHSRGKMWMTKNIL